MSFNHLLLVLVVCLVWAFNFIASAHALQHFPPILFTVLRFGLVFLILLPALKPPAAGQWPRLILVALCMGAIHFTLNFWALMVSSDISSVAIALQAYIPMSVVLAMIFLKEQVGWRTLTAIAVAFLGVLIVGVDPLVLQQLDALTLTLVSAFFLALGSMLMRGIKGISAFTFQAWTAVISIPVLLLSSLLLEHDQLSLMASADWVAWSGVLYSGLMASIVGHGMFFYLVQRHPVTSVTPYLLLTPIFAVILGIIFWGDEPGWRLLLGGLMVLIGVFIITIRAKQKTTAQD